jgi:hypothetical protein
MNWGPDIGLITRSRVVARERPAATTLVGVQVRWRKINADASATIRQRTQSIFENSIGPELLRKSTATSRSFRPCERAY